MLYVRSYMYYINLKRRSEMDVYKSVTDRIIAALEKGTVPWKQTWKSGAPANYVTGRPYSGCNLLLLSLVPYPSPLVAHMESDPKTRRIGQKR
jgi:hypothetical protein